MWFDFGDLQYKRGVFDNCLVGGLKMLLQAFDILLRNIRLMHKIEYLFHGHFKLNLLLWQFGTFLANVVFMSLAGKLLISSITSTYFTIMPHIRAGSVNFSDKEPQPVPTS